MQFLHPEYDDHLELSLEDVFIVPGGFEGTSRMEVDLTPPDFAGGSHPVVSANMNAVTGKFARIWASVCCWTRHASRLMLP